MFDLDKCKYISLEEHIMMLINLPDMGFSSTQNINVPDQFYKNIKRSTIQYIQIQNDELNLSNTLLFQ